MKKRKILWTVSVFLGLGLLVIDYKSSEPIIYKLGEAVYLCLDVPMDAHNILGCRAKILRVKHASVQLYSLYALRFGTKEDYLVDDSSTISTYDSTIL